MTKYKDLYHKEANKQTKWRRIAWVLMQKLSKKDRNYILNNPHKIQEEFFELQKIKKAWWL